MHQGLYEKRRQVVTSEYEPNEEECDFPSDDETDDEKNLSKDMEEKAKIDEKEDKYVLVPWSHTEYHNLGMLIGFVFCSVGKATVILCVDEYD